MSAASTSTTRSDSAQSRIAGPPTSDPAAADACFDTALPPMSSKQMVVTTRRPPRASESSLIATNLRNTNRAVAALPYTPGTTSIARGPSTHRRTGSTLKTVMRKIFTRKSRGQEDDESAECRFGNHSPRSNQSLDKPQPLSGSWNAKSTSPLQQEHGPVTSWEEALRKLEPHPRRRRATLPSLIFSDDESRGALEAVVHSGRPTSKRDNSPHANSDPDEVRRREMRQIKRRSRSATALRGMAKDHLMSPIQWRRRSLESYAGSTTFGAVSEADASERPPTRTTVASAPKPTTESSFLDGPDEDEEEDAPPEEPMPPMVGTLVNSLQHDENVTLEQRLTTLEVKLIDLECAIARIQSGRSETPAEPSGQRKPSPPTTRHKRKPSSAQSPSGSDEAPGAKSPGGADRPSSTSTLRPNHLHRSRTLQAPSSTSLHECNTISVEQYSALVMLLRREQSARRNLEEQVSNLRSDVEQLTRVARESMGMGPIYPIPIDAHDIMRMRQALGPSPTNSGPPTEKISPDSDSEERPELPPKGDLYHPRWPSARRVEVGGMI